MKTFHQILYINKTKQESLNELCNTIKDISEIVQRDMPIFDEEVIFSDGKRMAIQVCPADGECCWTQGVLFDEDGEELGCTEVQENLDSPFIVDCNEIQYVVNVSAENYIDKHQPIH